jgi:hypothetical protein
MVEYVWYGRVYIRTSTSGSNIMEATLHKEELLTVVSELPAHCMVLQEASQQKSFRISGSPW